MTVFPLLPAKEHWDDLVLFDFDRLFTMNQSFLSYKDVKYE